MNQHLWWFLARAAGLVAWLMLTASVIWGIVLSSTAFPNQRRPRWLLAMHRWLGGLSVAFLALHLGALVADSTVSFGLADITIPYASDWKPGAVALGIVALWLLVAVELTSLAMRRLSRRVWRRVHLSSYVVYWATCLHAAFAGTDAANPVYRAGAAASILAVALALVHRIATRRAARRPSGRTPRSPSDRAPRRAPDHLPLASASAERLQEVAP